MTLYVFAIGGTGTRVLRSLINLLASGVKLDNVTKVVPIIIDTDAENGDKSITTGLITKYITSRNNLYTTENEKSNATFFKTELSYFKTTDGVGTCDAFTNLTSSLPFISWLKEGSDNFEEKWDDLLKCLYDSSDEESRKELQLVTTKGYKGNPNIGSVVFNTISKHPDFDPFIQGFNNDDRVFIISSIFGGNGSSGFPTIVKLLRTNNRTEDALIGALSVLPYYEVSTSGEGENGAIKSSLFDLKAKSALDFYKDDEHIRSINALFYVADKDKRGVYDYNDGDEEQKNPASIIELIGASSIIKFCSFTNEQLSQPRSLGFGLPMSETDNGNNIQITIKHFTRANSFFHNKVIPNLLKMLYALKYLEYAKTDGNSTVGGVRVRNGGNIGNLVIDESVYIEYINSEFLPWVRQLANQEPNGRRYFTLLNNENNINELILNGTAHVSDANRNAEFMQKFSDTNRNSSASASLMTALHATANLMFQNMGNYQTF